MARNRLPLELRAVLETLARRPGRLPYGLLRDLARATGHPSPRSLAVTLAAIRRTLWRSCTCPPRCGR